MSSIISQLGITLNLRMYNVTYIIIGKVSLRYSKVKLVQK